jgi:RHS repeat-associated protein
VLDLGVTTSYGANSVNAYHSISGSAAPVHDDNGNMTSGPVNGSAASGMVFGKENNNLLQAVSGHTSDYVYDAMGRLVQLTRHDVGAGQTATEILTWAGWTLMSREIFTGNTVSETFRYTWGTDLSGTMEGAGGVGGLLAVERNLAGSNTWVIRYTHADANGNIIALTDSSGNVSARYRYDAFGKVLSATDVDASGWVNHNIHGFSSKPSFGNQGLLYYGYRWYSPSLGRWINRDPIEETGGMNLYGFVGNDGVGKWDLLGRNAGTPTSSVNPMSICQYYALLFREYSIAALRRLLVSQGVAITERQLVKVLESSCCEETQQKLESDIESQAKTKTASEGADNSDKEWCWRVDTKPRSEGLGTFCNYLCPSGVSGVYFVPSDYRGSCPLMMRREALENQIN